MLSAAPCFITLLSIRYTENQSSRSAGEVEGNSITTLVTIGLFGELVVMSKVDVIDVAAKFDADFERIATPAAWLPYALGEEPL
jgi:hypothetical protein